MKKQNNNSPSKIMEYVWLFMALLSAIAAIDKTLKFSAKDAYIFYIFIIISIIMYFIRRTMRKKDQN